MKYLYIFDSVADGSWEYLGTQNFGISYFYFHLRRLVPLDIDVLALIVNHICFVLSYHYAIKLVSILRWSTRYSYLFFLNPQLVWYSQLINKEPPTLLFVLLLSYLVVKRRKVAFILMAVVATLLRQQFLVFSGFLYALYVARRYRFRLCQLYVASAIGATILALNMSAETAEGLNITSSGFVRLIYNLNVDYYVGNLLLAPVKIIQMVYAQLLSLAFIQHRGPESYINLYEMKDVGVIIVIACLGRKLLPLLVHVGRGVYGPQRVMLSAIFAFMLMLLINPIVHQRYLFPVEVLLIVLGLCSPRYGGKSVRRVLT